MPFVCNICEQESTLICVRCTKDTCANHLCAKCGCCSDCCDCEVPLDEHEFSHVPTVHAGAPKPDPEPEPPHPPPDPDPFPSDEPEPEPGPLAD
jgi:hypothetical protein